MTLRTSGHAMATSKAAINAAVLASLSTAGRTRFSVDPAHALAAPHQLAAKKVTVYTREHAGTHVISSTQGKAASNGSTAKKAGSSDTSGEHVGMKSLAKKASITSAAPTDGHASAKKGGGTSDINVDNKAGMVRVGHSATIQRGRVVGTSVRRATADGGWTRLS